MMADFDECWGFDFDADRYYRRPKMATKFRTSQDKQPEKRESNKRTVGAMWLSKNYNFDEEKVGQKGAPPLFKGVYSIYDYDSKTETLVAFALWKTASFNGRANSLLATGTDYDGNAVFLRVSEFDSVKFFGNVVTKNDDDELDETLYAFTLFDGNNSSAWSGLMQVQDDEVESAPVVEEPKAKGKKSPPKSEKVAKPTTEIPY